MLGEVTVLYMGLDIEILPGLEHDGGDSLLVAAASAVGARCLIAGFAVPWERAAPQAPKMRRKAPNSSASPPSAPGPDCAGRIGGARRGPDARTS